MSYSNLSLHMRQTSTLYDDWDGRQLMSQERHRASCTISSIRKWFPSFEQLDHLFEIEASSTCCDTNNCWNERPFGIYAYQRISITLILIKSKVTWTYSFSIRTRHPSELLTFVMSNDSAATTRTANERCMEICHSCISYLNDRFVFEKGLFRSPASLTDVRLLQTQMIYQGSVINRYLYFQECQCANRDCMRLLWI